MAANKRTPIDDAVRFNFRLNPRRPKEKIVIDFLREHTANYDASGVIKQALYELATRRSWITGQPLHQYEPMPETPALVKPQDRLLDDMLAGLSDWMQQ